MIPPHLPTWALDILATPPQAGAGFHHWLFRAARALWKCGRNEEDIRAFLENAATTCGRRVENREILDAVANSREGAFYPAEPKQAPWPLFNREQREAVIANGDGLVDLWEASPVRFENNCSESESIIDRLFPSDALLCCGASKEAAYTAPRASWRGKTGQLQVIVPNPMSAETGVNQCGEISHRCLDNTGARRFVVVEYDNGTADEQAALLLHLAERFPLAVAVHSGNKSLHGWFYCAGQQEERVRWFFASAVSLGADKAMWPRCQLARMPDGRREDGTRQPVYFFNPEVVQ